MQGPNPNATGTPFVETHRGFVNTWECDENAHMNVQFYFRAFQQASEIFSLQANGSNAGSRSAIVRHVRYHRELAVARSTLVRSAVLGEGEHAGAIVHLLFDADSGELSATALDRPGYRVTGMPVCKAADVGSAMPRGVASGPTLPENTQVMIDAGRAFVSGFTVTRADDHGEDGDMLANALVSRLTDAAAHVWTFAGIAADWLIGTRHGRVAVETKLTRYTRIEAGAALRLVSWIGVMEEKTFTIRHQFEDMATGEAVAAADIRCLVMNLESRRAVPVPQHARDAFAALTGQAAPTDTRPRTG
ncbi:MAG: thioesterase family protein [Pseudomonadota bacterium]|nr:thioesterase family protein [Pseudomonadota bacterium]